MLTAIGWILQVARRGSCRGWLPCAGYVAAIAADMVGSGGTVVGVDISGAMLCQVHIRVVGSPWLSNMDTWQP